MIFDPLEKLKLKRGLRIFEEKVISELILTNHFQKTSMWIGNLIIIRPHNFSIRIQK